VHSGYPFGRTFTPCHTEDALPMSTGKDSKIRRLAGGIRLLYEDRDILVVDKPSGLLTMGTDRDKTRTAFFLVTDYVRKGNPKSPNRIFIVHRLDRDTSGVLLLAKTEAAKRTLQEQWDSTQKTYLAVVHGRLARKEGTISTYLAENSAHNVYSTNDPQQGKLSHTAYQVLQETKEFSLVEIDLLTGRKNQIRVHFAEIGHPVVGDRKYGEGKTGHPYLALHARAISFPHPFHGRQMAFAADIPDHFARLLGQAGRPGRV
jgi:tRNA pseudouridine32 synthase / 23S rRNA pseudouridine746 synthase